ncbi:MAG: PhnD/SsuA/transferrin family substrate-binding protein, partial [Desulfobulbaceae bacterium]|nr:PhnD/SsuA/transferrin family substrate-binding protein [Desulfobulbaceae bacterium]
MNSSPLSRLSKPRLLQPYPHGGTEKGSRGKAHEPAPVHRQGIGFRFRSFWHLLRCPIPPRHLLILVAIILQLLVPPLSVRASAREPLTLLVHPFLPAAELTRSFTPLTDYLSRTCGVPVRLEITKNYASHIRRVGEERFDIAFLGPAPFVEVTRTYGSKILLGRLEDNGSPFFHGVIIARRDSPIKNLNGLAGKRFAFGDPNSTMSHIVPRVMLAEAGIKTEQLQ